MDFFQKDYKNLSWDNRSYYELYEKKQFLNFFKNPEVIRDPDNPVGIIIDNGSFE